MTMRLLLDQNLSSQTTAFLGGLGYDVIDIRQSNLLGATDGEIVHHAQREGRIVITFDADFADMSEFPLGTHAGVIR